MAQPILQAGRAPRGAVSSLNTALFVVGLAAVLAIVAALPLFPSGDGPVHIYLSHILYLLAAAPASASAAPYEAVYSIRHLIQPYSLHYFWLIAAEHFVTTAVAEKSFVFAILLVNALGFRMLARQLASASNLQLALQHKASAGPVSLWILPLLLSWALASGFLNFCFAAGAMFAAYALYLRVAAARQTGAAQAGLITGYTLTLLLLILSHPVPLLLLLGLLFGDTVLLLWQRQRGIWPLGLALAAVAFVFPMLIADKAEVADSLLRDLRPHAAQLLAIVSGDRLSMFFSGNAAGILLTAVLVTLVPATWFLMARHGWLQRLRARHATPSDRLCFSATLLLIATLVFPESMNGSALFADRMVPLLWPLIFVAAASLPLRHKTLRWFSTLALCCTLASVAFAWVYLRPAARQQQALTGAALPEASHGLFFTGQPVRRPFGPHFADTILAWGGARAFAAHDDVLLNTPWMQLTIVPVRERDHAGLLRDTLPGSYSESPSALGQLLQTPSAARTQALAHADFLLFSAPSATTPQVRALLPTYLLGDAVGWSCTVQDFYAVCRRNTMSATGIMFGTSSGSAEGQTP